MQERLATIGRVRLPLICKLLKLLGLLPGKSNAAAINRVAAVYRTLKEDLL